MTIHKGCVPKQARFALENLCLLAKAGVDVSSPSTGDDTLQTRSENVRKRVDMDDLRSQKEARRAMAEFKKDMDFAGKPVDERQSATVKATANISPILAFSMVFCRLYATKRMATARDQTARNTAAAAAR